MSKNTMDFTLKFHEDLSKQYPQLLKKIEALRDDASAIDLKFLSEGLRMNFVDTQQDLKTFFSGLLKTDYAGMDSAKEKSLAKLEEAIGEQTSAIRQTYELLSGERVDATLGKAPMMWERDRVEEQIVGKMDANSPISPRLDEARTLYQNITHWLDIHEPKEGERSGEQYQDMETLRAIVFDFIRTMDNTLSGAEAGMTNEQSAYWRWLNMDGSYTGGKADDVKNSMNDEASMSYDELVAAIKELEQELKQTPATDIEHIGQLSGLLETLNQRRYMMGAMLHLDNEGNSVQNQINKKRKLIDDLYAISNPADEQSRLKSEMKLAKKELANATTVEAKVTASAKISEIQKQIDEATKGKLTIEAETEPAYIVQGSVADKRQSYSNAQTKASRIEQDYEIGLIGKDEALRQVDELNKELEKLGTGLKPIKIEVDSKGFAKAMGTIKDAWGGIQGIGSGVESITDALDGDKNAWEAISGVISGFISIAEGVQSIVAVIQLLTGATQAHAAATTADSTATAVNTTMTTANTTASATNIGVKSGEAIVNATASGAKMPFPANIVAIAAGVAAVVAALAMVTGAFATGGVVGGSSPSGDKLLARVNSGEMILNAAQQARLFAIANGAAVYGEALGVGTEWQNGLKPQEVKAQLKTLQRLAVEGQTSTEQNIKLRVRGRDLIQASGNELRSTRKRWKH